MFLFIKRLNETHYQKELLASIAINMLENLYSTFYKIIEKINTSKNCFGFYEEIFTNFLLYAVQRYNYSDNAIKRKINNLIDSIIFYFEKSDNNESKNLYLGMNFITMILSKTDKNSEIFNKLCGFVIKYEPKKEDRQTIIPDFLDENNLPHYTRHRVDGHDISEYRNILLKYQSK